LGILKPEKTYPEVKKRTGSRIHNTDYKYYFPAAGVHSSSKLDSVSHARQYGTPYVAAITVLNMATKAANRAGPFPLAFGISGLNNHRAT
jgi:hypothetical protein